MIPLFDVLMELVSWSNDHQNQRLLDLEFRVDSSQLSSIYPTHRAVNDLTKQAAKFMDSLWIGKLRSNLKNVHSLSGRYSWLDLVCIVSLEGNFIDTSSDLKDFDDYSSEEPDSSSLKELEIWSQIQVNSTRGRIQLDLAIGCRYPLGQVEVSSWGLQNDLEKTVSHNFGSNQLYFNENGDTVLSPTIIRWCAYLMAWVKLFHVSSNRIEIQCSNQSLNWWLKSNSKSWMRS